MTSIPGFASSISYHPSGRVAEILHANGQRFTEQPDPHGMARPVGLRLDQPNGSRVDWQLGPYEFDGSGNLTRVGGWFGYGRYDRVSRWKAATMEFSPRGFVYDVAAEYDDFGNLTGLSRGTDWVETPTVLATNRLKYGSYDASGNLTAWHGQTFAFDPLGRLTERCTDGQVGAGACPGARWAYAYGPDEARVLSYRFAPGTREWIWTDQPVRRAGEQPYSIWTLRDEAGRVLHERRFAWNAVGAEMEDYVWRGEGVLAAFLRPQGTVRHFALDHLGSVRVVSDGSGALLEHRRYEPYGHDPFGPQLDERRQWAGHERDLGDLTSPEDDLDYMQARFYSATFGRFLSVDPVLTGRALKRPQAWNRYTYTIGNPLKYIDPTGELWFKIDDKWTYLKGVDVIEEVTVGSDGSFSSKQVQGRGTFVGFNGSQLTLYGRDGSMRGYQGVAGRVDSLGRNLFGQQDADRGPLPEGRYSFDPKQIQNYSDTSRVDRMKGVFGGGTFPGGTDSWGQQRVWLTPDPANTMYGRGGFTIHGGTDPGSRGCIDLTGQAADFFSVVGGETDIIKVDVDYP